jgi:predicted DCC family thiol-disulfide oxidoreductase YuxK
MQPEPIVLFDGVCNLCSVAVNWIIDRDHRRVFRFASLQSEVARELLAQCGPVPDSIVLIDEAGIHYRSTAALRIARRLGFPWSMAIVARVLPLSIRDAIYRWIARNRYSWFGRTETCRIPTPERASRFLDVEVFRRRA